MQVKTVYLGGRSASRFIDRSKISDIIINEAITMMHIRVYLAIIVEGEDKMVVVFQVKPDSSRWAWVALKGGTYRRACNNETTLYLNHPVDMCLRFSISCLD